MNPDGTLPRDQAGTTPAVATGVTGARGLGWAPGPPSCGLSMTIRESGHLSGVSLSCAARAAPSSAAGRRFDRGGVDGGLHERCDSGNAQRRVDRVGGGLSAPASTSQTTIRPRWIDAERLLQDRVGPLRVVTVGPDGAIYYRHGARQAVAHKPVRVGELASSDLAIRAD